MSFDRPNIFYRVLERQTGTRLIGPKNPKPKSKATRKRGKGQKKKKAPRKKNSLFQLAEYIHRHFAGLNSFVFFVLDASRKHEQVCTQEYPVVCRTMRNRLLFIPKGH